MSKFSNLTKEELLALAEKQEAELASKKYGLVWDAEREPEQVVLDCEHHLPVLKRVKGKEIKTALDQGDNILIEGDNYHALTTLNYTHQGKIDVIYIDPPYNTGNKDFKYNDKFVDKEDGFRHSKWLNFMEKRLRLAKDLLNEKGVIFISIDDNEFSQLKLLSDKILGEDNFIGNLIWYKKRKGSFLSKTLVSLTEYVLVYREGSNNIHLFGGRPDAEGSQPLVKRTNTRKELFFKARTVQTKLKEGLYEGGVYGSGSSSITLLSSFSVKNGLIQNDFSLEGPFVWSQSMLDDEIIKGTIITINTKNLQPRVIRNYSDESHKGLPSFIDGREFSATTDDAYENLKEIFDTDRVFTYSKPKNLIKYLVNSATFNNKDSIILDFMAGSGTTGHAVLDLNKEDGGSRRFILCTNNENNICEDVTYPRLQKVIKGYKKNGDGEKVEGLGGNLQYFKTDLIKKTGNKDQMRINLTQKCTDMLCVKENIFNLETEHDDYKIFSSNQKDQFLCVYYNFYDESFDEFLKQVKKLKGHKKIYMFSMDGKVDKNLFKGISNFDLEGIPQKIIDIYKQLVKMNIPVKAETIFLDFEKAHKKIFEDQEKDEGARVLRIVLEKTLQKIAQKNGISILDDKGKEQKIALVNDQLKDAKIISKVVWEENKTFLAIGNHASHGDYDEYDLKKVENFYKHIQELHNIFGI